MSFELWSFFALAALVLSLTPGPNSLLMLDLGARVGFGRASFAALGAGLGMMLMVGASVAGLGALMAASLTLFTAVKLAGAGYLIYLGVKLFRTKGFGVIDAQPRPQSARRSFGTGFIVMIANPKTLLFFTTFLPGFMVPNAPLLPQFVILAGTLTVIEVGVELLLAALARIIRPWLTRHARAFNRTTGTAFVALGLLIAASKGHS
jgi:threonine/homoserine/homoserine lactone efflux protein